MKTSDKQALLNAAATVIEPALDEAQAAAVIGVPTSAMGKMRRSGKGPMFFMVGVRPRYRPEALRQWMASHEVHSMAEAYLADKDRAAAAEGQREAVAKVRQARWKRKPEAAIKNADHR
jgi:hypothetical protein